MTTQIIANALISSAAYLLVGLGFSIIYTTVRFFHIAHGIVFTFGAYTAFTLLTKFEFPLAAAFFVAIIASMVLGLGIDCFVYRPLRRKGGHPLVLLLVSLGIYISLQAILTLLYGAGTQTLRGGAIAKGIGVVGAVVTIPQIATIITSILCTFSLWWFLQKTETGTKIRAVGNDPYLAEICGVDYDSIVKVVYLFGSALAGIAAVLIAYTSDLTPTMGFQILFMGMIAMIIGGVGSVPGVAVGAIFLGLIQHFSAWWISSAWQDAIVFFILIFFLMVRPQGFLGKPIKKTEI